MAWPRRAEVKFTMSNDADRPTGAENGGDEPIAIDRERLPIVPAGEPLVEHEVYIDVLNPGHGPFRALAGQTAGSGNGYVAERDVDPAVWDHLVREDAEARLRQEAEREAAAAETNPVEPGISGIGHTT